MKSYTYLGNVTDYLEIKGSLREIRPCLAFHNEAYIYYDSEEYMGIKGKSKACIKINGKTVMDENDKAKYWNIQDGKIDIRMAIPENTIVKRVMIVVGERQAYTECKLETNFTTDMLCSQSNVHYSYNKQKKILQIYKESYEGYEDKKIYKNIYDTKNLALVLHEPIFQYCDVFKGTFSFLMKKDS